MDRDKDRATGRTTALALSYLSDAIRNPGKPITVRDHGTKPRYQHELLLGMIGRMGCQLGLDVTTNKTRMTVVSTYGRPSPPI